MGLDHCLWQIHKFTLANNIMEHVLDNMYNMEYELIHRYVRGFEKFMGAPTITGVNLICAAKNKQNTGRILV